MVKTLDMDKVILETVAVEIAEGKQWLIKAQKRLRGLKHLQSPILHAKILDIEMIEENLQEEETQ